MSNTDDRDRSELTPGEPEQVDPGELEQVDPGEFETAVHFWQQSLLMEVMEEDDLETVLQSMKQGQVFAGDHEITVDLPRTYEPWETTLGAFLRMIEECQTLNLLDNTICETADTYYFHVLPVNPLAELYLSLPLTLYKDLEPQAEEEPLPFFKRVEDKILTYDEIDTYAEVQVGSQLISVDFINGVTPFGLALARNGEYEKHFPPVSDTDMFVYVVCENKIELDLAKQVCHAYLFEVASSLGLEFTVDRRPTPEYVEHEEEMRQIPELRMRPLQVSSGLDEVYRLYNQALAFHHLEFQVINLVKVIEFVSRTVVRLKANEEIRGKLLTREALSPSAKFIADLESTVLKQEKLREDRQAIIATVVTCCDAFELAQYAPPHLGDLKKLSARSTQEQRLAALGKFAGRAYATRNALAHAKANYKRTGEECPEDQLEPFVRCLKVAAQHVIRWYAGLHESQRIFAFDE